MSLKLCPPRPAAMEIERGAVAAALAQTKAAVVLFSAPAGYGKSTAMGQWLRALRSQGVPVAWLTVDANDNDPGRFGLHLYASLASLLPDSSTVRNTRVEGTAGGHAYRLLDVLAATETPFVVFVDEAEHLDSAEVLATLAYVIEALGPHQRIVIGSRTRPNLPLGRLRARGLLLEVDEALLRFSMDETRNYLMARPQMSLSDADVQQLQRRTDGWPAALQLATALGGSTGIGAVLGSAGDFSRDLAAYLAEDVLARLPVEQ
ncbi:MAG: hypothetical protein JSS56_22125, partial [Proteobacteria bacterium]|nr:hypothetical protein [Pseudomonadota bacterium]